MSAIIFDGHLKSALSAVRSLGRKNVAFAVGSTNADGMALHSRYTKKSFVYPSPYTSKRAFIAEVKKVSMELGEKPLVYVFSDATYLSLYAHREELSEYMTLVFPDVTSVEIAFDKGATYSLAKVSSVPTITTYIQETPEQVRGIAEELAYPAVIKSRKSVSFKDGIGIFASAVFVFSKEELQKKFTEMKETLGEAPLIQTFVFGEEYGVEMLADNGAVYAEVVHHRIRSLSPTGGASVLKETMREGELKTALLGYAHTLVSKLSWSGPIMVEFKVDSDTREPKLMEINGRFWGSLPLAVACGVDMPYLFYAYVMEGKKPRETVTGNAGVSTIHFLGDIKHLQRVFFAHDPMRKMLYPKRLQALKDFLVHPRGVKYDVWSFHDPKPSVMEIIAILKKIWD
jgi:predicted ATP-grasp superfamily ATP-dependent carboligase